MNRRGLFFALAVLFQVLMLAAVPAQKVYTRTTGKSAMLKIRPVDPYNLLSGYYVTLGYQIGDLRQFGTPSPAGHGETVFAIIERRDNGIWDPVSLSKSLPTDLPENRLAIRGRQNYGSIEYGIEEFFIPEDNRGEISEGLTKHPDQARVEVKIDSNGQAALVRLLIGDRVYDD